MQCLYILLPPIHHRKGGVRDGSKRSLGIEENGPFRCLQIGVPCPPEQEMIRIRTQEKIHMVDCPPQVPEVLVTESLFIHRIVITLKLMHVGVKRDLFEPCEIMHQLPGIDCL